MVLIPFELSRIYVINLKERELKMLKLLLREVEVQLNIILNLKTDNDLLLQMPEAEEASANLMMCLLNSILKLLI